MKFNIKSIELRERQIQGKRKLVDLAFSGTGPVRFPAWIGVLRYIEEMGYGVRRLIGTSGGGLIGGMYMAGMSVDDIETVTFNVPLTKFAKANAWRLVKMAAFPTWLGGGYMNNGSKVERFLSKLLDKKTMGDVPGLYITATDMVNGRRKIFSAETDPDFPVARAIRASISLPLIWNGVRYNNTVLFDGGLRYNFPIDYFEPSDGVPIIGFAIEPDFCTVSEQYNFKDVGSAVISNMVQASDIKHREDALAANQSVDLYADRGERNQVNYPEQTEEDSRYQQVCVVMTVRHIWRVLLLLRSATVQYSAIELENYMNLIDSCQI